MCPPHDMVTKLFVLGKASCCRCTQAKLRTGKAGQELPEQRLCNVLLNMLHSSCNMLLIAHTVIVQHCYCTPCPHALAYQQPNHSLQRCSAPLSCVNVCSCCPCRAMLHHHSVAAFGNTFTSSLRCMGHARGRQARALRPARACVRVPDMR